MQTLDDATLFPSLSCDSHPSQPSKDTTLGSPGDEQGTDLN